MLILLNELKITGVLVILEDLYRKHTLVAFHSLVDNQLRVISGQNDVIDLIRPVAGRLRNKL